jgi:hypothetical protein
VDNQQLGNFSQRDMENIVDASVQKLEAAFTAKMQTLLATQQKIAQNFTPAPSADDKRTAAQVEEAKSSKKRKIRRHRSEYCGDCGQDDHTWSSDVLCVAKDQTSVDIMCRRFCCNFLWKSRL